MTPSISRSKIALQFVFLLLIGIGVVSGVRLVQTNQEIREEAATTTINYPAAPKTITDLNPVNLPFINTSNKFVLDSTYDRSGGNADGSGYVRTEGGKYVLIDKSGVSGMITRIWHAQPVSGASTPTLDIITNTSGSTTTVNLLEKANSNSSPFTFPLIANAKRTSGGIVSYAPIQFSGRLKVLSRTNPGYTQINYVVSSVSSSSSSEFGSLASLWKTSNMGKTSDLLSVNSAGYGGTTNAGSSVSLSSGQTKSIFQKTGGGVVAKISFPASQINSNLGKLWLKINYQSSNPATVNLPLDLVFNNSSDSYTSSLPPFSGIDAHVFAPTGKEIVIDGSYAWIREPYLETYTSVGLNDNWYRVKLSDYFQSGGATPPTSAIDSYSINQSGGETVIKGGTFWYRSSAHASWITDSLSAAWPGSSSNGFPLPHSNINSHAFALNGAETITSGGRYWSRQSTSSSWWSDTIEKAWSLGISSADGHSVSTTGTETIISGDKFWSRTSVNAGWHSGTLSSAWNNSNMYLGSLFFGYDSSSAEYYLTWPIPYWDGINISLENKGSSTINVTPKVYWTTSTYNQGQAGYLDIDYRSDTASSSKTLFNAADISGKGKFVGLVILAEGDSDPQYNRTFLEGDDLIYVDGQKVGNGTGLEDVFNAGWYFLHGPFYLPTHGAHLSPPSRLQSPIPGDGKKRGIINSYDTSTYMYRHYLSDAINFQNTLKYQIEFGHCGNGGCPRLSEGLTTKFRSVSIAYLSHAPAPPQCSVASKPTISASCSNYKNDISCSWTGVNDATEYQAQIDNNSDFSSPIIDSTTTSASVSKTAVNADVNYYCRVRVTKSNGSCTVNSQWSTVATVKKACPTPSPNCSTPNSDITATCNSNYKNDLKCSWSSVSNATEYQGQIDNNSDFSSPLVNTAGSSTSRSLGNVTADRTYYCRSRVTESNGSCTVNNVWSSVNSIKKACPTPTPPDSGADPKGTHDPTTWQGCVVRGWACDESNYSKPINVHIYEGNNIVGGTWADDPAEQGIADLCGGYANHRFTYDLPDFYKDGNPHSFTVYAIGIDSSGTHNSNNPKLSGTPQTVTCEKATVTPPPVSTVGDANADGQVEITDYAVWREQLETNQSTLYDADFNSDGVVDGGDYLIWLNNYSN